MPAIRNEVAALKICCAPDIAKRRLCVVGDVLGSKKQLQGVYLHRSVEGFLADDPQSRDCHFPRRVVSFPAAWEQQVRKEPSMQRPSFEISKTGPPTEVKTGGGGKLGYCLPANAPLVAQQQAEGCSQHWHATPIGLMSESGPLYFEEDPQLMNWTEVIWTQASWEVHHPIVSQRFSIIDIRQQPLPNLQEQCQQPPVYNTTLDVDSAGRALQGSWVPFYEGKHGACRIEVSGLPDVESSGSWQVAKFGRQQIKQQKKSWAERKGCLTLLMPKLSLPAGKEARQHMLRKNHAKVHIGVKQPGVLGSPQQEPSPSSATYTILAAELATPQKEYCSARWHAEDLVKQWGYLGGVQLRHLLFAPVKPSYQELLGQVDTLQGMLKLQDAEQQPATSRNGGPGMPWPDTSTSDIAMSDSM